MRRSHTMKTVIFARESSEVSAQKQTVKFQKRNRKKKWTKREMYQAERNLNLFWSVCCLCDEGQRKPDLGHEREKNWRGVGEERTWERESQTSQLVLLMWAPTLPRAAHVGPTSLLYSFFFLFFFFSVNDFLKSWLDLR